MKNLILLIFLPISLFAQWTEINNLKVSSYEMQMLNEDTGFVSTFYGLQKTTDGWKTTTNCSSNEIIYKFHAINEKTIVKTSHDLTLRTNLFSQTFNSGGYWDTIQHTYPIAFNSLGISGDTLITNIDSTKIIISHNYGLDWDTINVINSSGVTRDFLFLKQNLVMLKKHRYIADGQIYLSKDQGKTWTFNPNRPNNILSLWPTPNKEKVWAVGIHGLVANSLDGGSTWETMTAPSDTDLVRVKFLNDSLGFVCGGDAILHKWGKLYRTKDGGNSWEDVTPNANSMVTDIYFINDSVGYALFENGQIFKTTNGGGSAIKDTNTSIDSPTPKTENNYSVYIYPNPSESELNVTWNYTSPEEGRIHLLDLQGRVLLNEPMPIEQSLNLELNDLSSGLYFISIQTPEKQKLLRWIKK